MCTLTFIPSQESESAFILTSNRDESPHRNTVLPKHYREGAVDLYFPKDKVAGGTWLGISSRKRLVCLLNGAFTAHKRQENYRMSRGLVVKKLLKTSDVSLFIENFDFFGIEPFTLVLVAWDSKLAVQELIWDGKQTYFRKLPVAPYIWSAPMLYPEEVRAQKEAVFEKFMQDHGNQLNPELMWQLNKQFWLDHEQVSTISTTQILHTDGKQSHLKYQDWLSGEKAAQKILF